MRFSGKKPQRFDVEAERAAIGLERAYTVSQVAEIFDVSESTVYRAIAQGRLHAEKRRPSRGWVITRQACRDWMRSEKRYILT